MIDYALESFIFKEPLQLIYTGDSHTLYREVATMEDVTDLMEEIHRNKWPNGVGIATIEFQLWFALARKSKFFIE